MAERPAELINRSLFQGNRVYLAAPDPDKDAEVEALWTRDSDSLHLVSLEPPRPLSAAQIRKNYEAAAKDSQNAYSFAIRLRADDRLIGAARLDRIEWSHGCAWLSFLIGDPGDRGHGYGSETFDLILRYAFDELNLYRLTVRVFEYNLVGLEFLKMAGFQVEVRQRQAVHRLGRRWDILLMGLIHDDWVRLDRQGGQPQ